MAREGNESKFRAVDVNETPQAVSTSNGVGLVGWNIHNPNNEDCYVKFYDSDSPTVGTTTPDFVVLVPGNSNVFQEDNGYIQRVFTTGMSIAAVTGLADNNTDAPTSDLLIELIYE